MIYSPSRLNTARSCARKFYYHYGCGYREVLPKPWLKTGSAVDDLLAIYDTNGFEIMMSKVDSFFTDPHERIVYKQLLIYYHDKFKDEVLRPIEIEGKPGNQWHFNLPLDPEGIDTDIRIQGYLDKVSGKENKLCVVERKTTSQNISYVADYWKTLKLDTQIAGYCWALSKTLDTHIGLVIYEVLRKPKVPKNHKVKGVETPYTMEEFEQQVIKVLNRSTHAERRLFWFDVDAIEEWKFDVLATDDMVKTYQLNQKGYESQGLDGKFAWHRCQGACKNYGGCVYLPVCSGEVGIETFDLVTKV